MAKDTARGGADMVGIVFAEGSKRTVRPATSATWHGHAAFCTFSVRVVTPKYSESLRHHIVTCLASCSLHVVNPVRLPESMKR